MAKVVITKEEDQLLTSLNCFRDLIKRLKCDANVVLVTDIGSSFIERLGSPRTGEALTADQWLQMREMLIDRIPTVDAKITSNALYQAAVKYLGSKNTLGKLFCVYLPIAATSTDRSSPSWLEYWIDGNIDANLRSNVDALHRKFECLDPSLLEAVASSIRTNMQVQY